MDKVTGKPIDIITFLMSAGDKEAVYDLTLHKDVKKRSLDANAYFHVLCDKLRQKMNVSMAYCKNYLIASYGQIFYLPDDTPLIYKTNAPEEYMMELETIHTKCIKISEENGKNVYFYRVYRGSSDLNSAEMALLIKGTVEECAAQDIETATPDEIARMNQLWGQKKDARSDEESSNTPEGQRNC